MKQLNDKDIADMIGMEFVPNDPATRSAVRGELHLSKRIPTARVVPEHITIDFHEHTEEQAWNMICDAATSGAKTATVITGASGILKIKFQQWVRDSLISPYIFQCKPINNGSFDVKFKQPK
ncbi:MAG: hypothetical protein J5608_01045 [Alphaproteobacteria bacterium]|nr:hypothetical protein [Alphaproteobacteria bacterium]